MSEPDQDAEDEEAEASARPKGMMDGGQKLDLAFHGCSVADNCDLGCDPGCHLVFPRLSTLLLLTAALAPRGGSGRLAHALIVFYRRFLSRWTPRCPATPSCSAYALDAITRLGTRRGLVAAATRIRDCG